MPNTTLPHDLEVERALLCACLLNPQIIRRLDLDRDDWYIERHALIYDALRLLQDGADAVTLKAALEAKGNLEKAGSVAYLIELTELASTWAGWKRHQEIIQGHSKRRQVIRACMTAAHQAEQSTEELSEILSTLKSGITAIDREQSPEIASSLSIIQEVYKDIEERHAHGNRFVGTRTGIQGIDDNLSGMEPGSSTYLIARPSIGKTALALTISDYVAQTQGPVLFFSLESNRQALTRRRLAAHSHVFLSRIRTGHIEDNQWEPLQGACEKLSSIPLMIVDHARYKDPERLCSLAETVSIDKQLALIVVDHVQLLRARRQFSSRHHEISYASDVLQGLAKTCRCPVLILCQLNREADKRAGKSRYPQLSDMKECVTGGTIIQTSKGPRKIRNLYKLGHCNFLVKSMNPSDHSKTWVRPEKVVSTGKRKCFRIRLKSGKIIMMTGDSQLYDGNDWKKVTELKAGDFIFSDPTLKSTRAGVTLNTGNSHLKPGNAPWNKGLTSEIDQRVKVNAERCRGKRKGLIVPDDFSTKMRLRNPPIGTKKNNRGYVLIYNPEWASASNTPGCWHGYVFEHRMAIEKYIGRMLNRTEVVHHLDGNKENNKLENLFLCRDAKEHEIIHQLEQRFTESLVAAGKVYFDGKDFQFRS